jgi:hypothetical protein
VYGRGSFESRAKEPPVSSRLMLDQVHLSLTKQKFKPKTSRVGGGTQPKVRSEESAFSCCTLVGP